MFERALDYCLKEGPPAAELKAIKNAPVIDLAPMLDDFADAAGVVAELDLIIMTDSAVAHLAGAMGKPVWLLLNFGPYWIWGDGGGIFDAVSLRLMHRQSRK